MAELLSGRQQQAREGLLGRRRGEERFVGEERRGEIRGGEGSGCMGGGGGEGQDSPPKKNKSVAQK